MSNWWPWSLHIIQQVQGLGDGLAWPMHTLSALGRAEFYLVVIPLLYWCLDPALGLRVGAMLMVSSGLNTCLKIGFHEPRPYWTSTAIRTLAGEPTFGFPSGHAQHGAAVWGTLARALRSGWSRVALAFLAVLIGISRLYLGVHHAHDVLAGWVIGLCLLALMAWLEPPLARWWRRASVVKQLAAVLAVSLGYLAAGGLIVAALGGWQVPVSWSQAALALSGVPIAPLDPEQMVMLAGIIAGMGGGWVWIERRGGFLTVGSIGKRFLRYGLGLAGVALLYVGLKLALPVWHGLAGEALRYLRYAAIGLWVTGGAPLCFLRLGLASAPVMGGSDG